MDINVNNIKTNQTFGANKMEKREPQNFRDQVDIMLESLTDRVERGEVAEYGDFAPVLEVFDNMDKDTQYYVGKYGLRIYKMPKIADPDPKKRYIEAAAYVPSGDYKADDIVGSGDVDEIKLLLKDPEFADKLCVVYGKLLTMIRNQ